MARRSRAWTLSALTSVLGGFALVVPTMLAVRIVDRPMAAAPSVVQPVITTQASTTRALPVSGWPASLRLALRLGLLVSEPPLDRSS